MQQAAGIAHVEMTGREKTLARPCDRFGPTLSRGWLGMEGGRIQRCDSSLAGRCVGVRIRPGLLPQKEISQLCAEGGRRRIRGDVTCQVESLECEVKPLLYI